MFDDRVLVACTNEEEEGCNAETMCLNVFDTDEPVHMGWVRVNSDDSGLEEFLKGFSER